MKKILLALLVPLVISATAVAAPNPASANAHCKNLMRKSPAMFSPATGFQYANLAACVAAKTSQAAKNTTNAAKTCKAAQAADAKAFSEKYAPATGNGKSNGKSAAKSNNGKAMGACVSATAKANTVKQQKAELNAAKQCKAERAACHLLGRITTARRSISSTARTRTGRTRSASASRRTRRRCTARSTTIETVPRGGPVPSPLSFVRRVRQLPDWRRTVRASPAFPARSPRPGRSQSTSRSSSPADCRYPPGGSLLPDGLDCCLIRVNFRGKAWSTTPTCRFMSDRFHNERGGKTT